MEETLRAYIRKGIIDNRTKNEIRALCVSEALKLDGFDEIYEEIRKELGVDAVKSNNQFGAKTATYNTGIYDPRHGQAGRRLKTALIFLSVALLAGVAFWGLYLLMSSGSADRATSADNLLKTKLHQRAASLDVNAGRFNSYEDVCQITSVEEPMRCRSSQAGYTVYAPLQNGGYYCIDNSGYAKEQDSPPLNGARCR